MADNRLYIGNKDTLDWVCITKSFRKWKFLDASSLDDINKMLCTDWASALVRPTNLVFFSEADTELYNLFMGKGQKVGEAENPENPGEYMWRPEKPEDFLETP